MKVIKEFDNILLKRKEVVIENEYNSNPGVVKVTSEIAEHFKVDENVVVVRKLESNFGTNDFLIGAFVYDSLKNKEKIEPKKKEKKKAGGS